MSHWLFTGLTLLALLCAVSIAYGLRVLLARLPAEKAASNKIAPWFLLAILLWLGLTAALAGSGFLSHWDARPPRFPFIPLLALAAVVALHRTKRVRQLLVATPRHWPVAFQTFRIGVELSFWGLYAAGGAPVQVTFEGRNFDVLVGLSAPFVALAIARFNLAPRWIVTWNAVGMAILANTIFTTMTSLPGPIHLNWPGIPFTAFGDWPFVWIPAFLAPLAMFLHIFSIRQSLQIAQHKPHTAPLSAQ